MATITKRGHRWSAQIRMQGFPSQSRTFDTKSAARAWAANVETQLNRGECIQDRSGLKATTLGDILARYRREVTPRKRGAESERYRLKKIERDTLCRTSVVNLSAAHLAAYRDRRLAEAAPATVHREMALISRVDSGVQDGRAIVDALLRQRQTVHTRSPGAGGKILWIQGFGIGTQLRQIGHRLARLLQQGPARSQISAGCGYGEIGGKCCHAKGLTPSPLRIT